MGNWTEHGANTGGYYKCNKFDPSSDGDDQSDAAKAKRELDRYLHYYKRFHAHSQAQDFAKKSLKETEQRMVLLQEQNSDTVWTDVEFLKTANEQLVECRKVLKYTYCYGFYLQDAEKRQRFEYHQEMLERCVCVCVCVS
jgi:ariadne-1